MSSSDLVGCGLGAPLLPLMGPLSYPSVSGWGSRGGRWGGSFPSESSFLNCAYADLNPEIRVSVLGVRTATSAIWGQILPLGSLLQLPQHVCYVLLTFLLPWCGLHTPEPRFVFSGIPVSLSLLLVGQRGSPIEMDFSLAFPNSLIQT